MGSYQKDGRDGQHTAWRSAVAVLSALLLLVVGLNAVKYWPSSETEVAESPTADDDTTDATLDTRPTPSTIDVQGPDSPQTLTVTVGGNALAVTGTAPNPEVEQRMAAFPTDLYGSSGSATITPGGSESPAWLNNYEGVIRQLGTFSEATLEIAQDRTLLDGVIASQLDLDRMERLLSGENGFPPLQSSVEISGLQTARVNVLPTSDEVNVDGSVPDQASWDLVMTAVRTAYDREIIDTLSIDPNVANQPNLARFADDLVALSVFTNQSTSFANGQTRSFISGELTFAAGQSELTEESAAALSDLPDFLIRTGLDVRIIGHTDDVGDQQVNTLLSIDRAKSVAGVLLEANVDSDQIIVSGRGERSSSEGAVTEEQRAGDRSVDIEIGTVIN